MRNTLLHADCFDVFKTIEANSIDLIVCDLPYGTTNQKKNTWDCCLPLPALWEAYRRIIKPNGAIVLTAQAPFSYVLGASNLKDFSHSWTWIKSRSTGHLNSKHQPLKNTEEILVFSPRGKPTFNPQGLVAIPPKLRKGRDNGTNYGDSAKDSFQTFTNYPKSTLTFASEGKGWHPTQKPLGLWEYLIRTYSNPGDLVMDNCAGSGTTAIACMNTGRDYFCIERDQIYFNKALERIKAAA